MFAVVKTGGKQYKVAEGQVIAVELLDASTDDVVTLQPVLIGDGSTVVAGPELKEAKVTAKVVGTFRGKKINGFDYKNKSNQSKRWGHRQNLMELEITGISKG